MYSIEHTYIYIFNISIFFIYRYSFERWPEILVIHMKRFAPTGSYRAKLTSNIHAPLRNLDLRYLLIYYFASNLSHHQYCLYHGLNGPGILLKRCCHLKDFLKVSFFQKVRCVFQISKSQIKNIQKQERKGFRSMIASSQFRNLAIWQLGNLAT